MSQPEDLVMRKVSLKYAQNTNACVNAHGDALYFVMPCRVTEERKQSTLGILEDGYVRSTFRGDSHFRKPHCLSTGQA